MVKMPQTTVNYRKMSLIATDLLQKYCIILKLWKNAVNYRNTFI